MARNGHHARVRLLLSQSCAYQEESEVRMNATILRCMLLGSVCRRGSRVSTVSIVLNIRLVCIHPRTSTHVHISRDLPLSKHMYICDYINSLPQTHRYICYCKIYATVIYMLLWRQANKNIHTYNPLRHVRPCRY
jgi:hypothetical protein